MNSRKSLIRLEDLPPDIQEKILHQLEIQENKEQIKESKELANQNPGTKIIINNRNKYYITTTNNTTNNIRALKNDGLINERKDSLLETFMKEVGKASGRTLKWLGEESK